MRGNSVTRLVKRFGNFLQRQAWEEFEDTIDLSVSLYDEMFGDTAVEEPQVISLPKEFRSLANKNNDISSILARNYLRERNVTREDIVRWKIGYCASGEYEKRIIIPSFNLDGKVDYFIARTYARGYKYKNPENATKDIIFNQLYIDWDKPVHLVEGAFDAIVAGNAIPLLQSSLREDSKLFQEIVKHDVPVYVALDPDAEKSAMSLIKSLLSYDVECRKVTIDSDEDVSELGKKRYARRVQLAELVDSRTYLQKLAIGI